MAVRDEFALIRLLTGRRQPETQLRRLGVETGIGDDAAVTVLTPGWRLVLSCDTMVEGVHFRADTMRAADVGFKAMASSISDMAAMGAVPRYALVSLTAPRTTPSDWLERLYDGLYECAGRYDVAVVGGDTTSTRSGVVIAVTIVGEVEPEQALLRSGARPGDVVFVTGPLGGPAGGLDWLLAHGRELPENEGSPSLAAGGGAGAAESSGAPDATGQGWSRSAESAALPEQTSRRDDPWPPELAGLIRRHQRPLPDAAAGRLLLASGACRSLNDISDGLASEAAELAAASGCGIRLDAAAIPLEPGLDAYAQRVGKSALDWALYGGEDYRLVGTLAPEQAERTLERLREAGIPAAAIGEATAAWQGVRLRRLDGTETELAARGYNHFA